MNHHFIKEIKDTKKVLCVIRGVITTLNKAQIKYTNKTDGNIRISDKVNLFFITTIRYHNNI